METLDAGVLDDDSPFVLMELLEGMTLRELLQRTRVLSPTRTAHLMVQACEGLAVAHEHGIIHRDLKPENLFVQVDGRNGGEQIKLLDFGISKFARDQATGYGTKSLLGTPEYMSPEQIRESKDIDERTDIYALGVVIYEAVCGQRPFGGRTSFELSNQIVSGRHRRASELSPELAPDFDAIIERALHHDRARRFGSANELRKALQAWLAGAPAPAPSAESWTATSDTVPASMQAVAENGESTLPAPDDASDILDRARDAPLTPTTSASTKSGASDQGRVAGRARRLGLAAALLMAIAAAWRWFDTTPPAPADTAQDAAQPEASTETPPRPVPALPATTEATPAERTLDAPPSSAAVSASAVRPARNPTTKRRTTDFSAPRSKW